MTKHITICAGIDTGKRKLDVAIEGYCEQLQVDNTPEGHELLLAWLRKHRVNRVGIEASGGYEQPVVIELRRRRFVVVMFQPAQVRGYAKFQLQRAKNDKIDAALIASCTAAVRKIHAAPDPRLLPFAERLTMIDQIGEDVARLKNRIESCRNAMIKKLWQEDIARQDGLRLADPPQGSSVVRAISSSLQNKNARRLLAGHPVRLTPQRQLTSSPAGRRSCRAE